MYCMQLEAHKRRGQEGPLHGLQGLVLLQVGEVLYTANTAGNAQAILCRSDFRLAGSITEERNHAHCLSILSRVYLGLPDAALQASFCWQHCQAVIVCLPLGINCLGVDHAHLRCCKISACA